MRVDWAAQDVDGTPPRHFTEEQRYPRGWGAGKRNQRAGACGLHRAEQTAWGSPGCSHVSSPRVSKGKALYSTDAASLTAAAESWISVGSRLSRTSCPLDYSKPDN